MHRRRDRFDLPHQRPFLHPLIITPEVDMPCGASDQGGAGQTHIRGEVRALSTPQRGAEPNDACGGPVYCVGSVDRVRAADATARPRFFARRPEEISALLSAFYSKYLDFERYLTSPAIDVTPTGNLQGVAAKNIARADFIRYAIAMMNGFKVRLTQIQCSLGQGESRGGEGLAASKALIAEALGGLDGAIAQWTEWLRACGEPPDLGITNAATSNACPIFASTP
jgi:hypothetical protein